MELSVPWRVYSRHQSNIYPLSLSLTLSPLQKLINLSFYSRVLLYSSLLCFDACRHNAQLSDKQRCHHSHRRLFTQTMDVFLVCESEESVNVWFRRKTSASFYESRKPLNVLCCYRQECNTDLFNTSGFLQRCWSVWQITQLIISQ